MTGSSHGVHMAVLLLCALMLGAAVAIALIGRVDGPLVIAGVAVPSTCIFKNATGLPCAGCGLTRSWVCLASGDLGASLHYHRLGWLVMLYVGLQAVRHGIALLVDGRVAPASPWWSVGVRWGRRLDRGLLLLVFALFVNWVVVLRSLL